MPKAKYFGSPLKLLPWNDSMNTLFSWGIISFSVCLNKVASFRLYRSFNLLFIYLFDKILFKIGNVFIFLNCSFFLFRLFNSFFSLDLSTNFSTYLFLKKNSFDTFLVLIIFFKLLT